MPLSKLKFSPGINRDTTDYTNAGGWFDCDKVRFRNGLPEKIGGWQKFLPQQFDGTAREIMRWASLNSTVYTAIGTNTKVYINGGSLGGLTDITPVRETAALTNPFTTTVSSVVTTGASGTGTTATITFAEQPFAQTVGTSVTISGVTPAGYNGTYTVTASSTTSVSYANATTGPQTVAGTVTIGTKVVTVTDAGHGCSPGDYVTFSGSGAVGGVPADDLNKEQVVVSVLSSSIYTILVNTTSSSGATGGGSVTAAYQVNIGLDTLVFGTGWGAGPFGGAASPFSTTVLGSNPISTNDSTNVTSPYDRTTVTFTTASAHGLIAGDVVYFSGASSVGGVDAKFLNRAFDIVSVTTTPAHTLTVYAWTLASGGTATGGGNGITMIAYKPSSAEGWGDPSRESTLALQLRLWSFDNFGEDLVMNPRDGGIYYWVENTPTLRAVDITTLSSASNCPTVATKVLISEVGQHTIAFGANPFGGSAQDKMLVRWSTDQSVRNWDEAATDENAGSIRLSNGSFIMTAEQTRKEILVWTDTALYSMQYTGSPYIFTASLISSGTDIIGPNCVATAVNTTFWMGSDNFYYYDGTVNRMPCTVREQVFPNLNFEQRYKVFASVNSELNEIIWFYPSNTTVNGITNTENDSYVIYNYAEKCWYYGTMGRTCWVDRGFGDNPIAASSDRYLYSHEVGADDGSTNPPSAIAAYITSSPVEIEDGDRLGFVSRIIPDISFRQTPEQNPVGEVDFTIYPQNFPGGMAPLNANGVPTNYYGTGDENAVKYNYSVKTFTQQLFTRIRGRSVILKVSSDGLGVQWRLGTPRFDIRTDGRR
jgi:hypothetical protein